MAIAQRTYKARIISCCRQFNPQQTVATVAIYYTSPSLGVCDVEYMEIVAETDEAACREALLSYLN